jgi:hypothetical protein
MELYPCSLQSRLPRIRVPLAEGDADAVLDLQEALELVYRHGRFSELIDYSNPCAPPLSPGDAAWAKTQIARGQSGDG